MNYLAYRLHAKPVTTFSLIFAASWLFAAAAHGVLTWWGL